MKICKKCSASFEGKRCNECVKLYNAKWRSENPEKHRAARDRWDAANTEKRKAAKRKWRVEHREQVLIKSSQWAMANRDKTARAWRNWVAKHPGAIRVIKENRRSRQGNGKISKGLVEKLFILQRGKCACCSLPLSDTYHLDHRMPLALGGANEDWNMQLLRQRCNNQKGAKHPVDFMQERGLLL